MARQAGEPGGLRQKPGPHDVSRRELCPSPGQETGLVATSRVFYLSGYIQDVGKLAKMAHTKGSLLLVDDYQGTGQIPIDVKQLDLDFLVTGTLKWLMGGPGLAFIYVREESDRTPASNHDRLVCRTRAVPIQIPPLLNIETTLPALRPVHRPLLPIFAASAALDMVLEIGVERIRERTRYPRGRSDSAAPRRRVGRFAAHWTAPCGALS